MFVQNGHVAIFSC